MLSIRRKPIVFTEALKYRSGLPIALLFGRFVCDNISRLSKFKAYDKGPVYVLRIESLFLKKLLKWLKVASLCNVR